MSETPELGPDRAKLFNAVVGDLRKSASERLAAIATEVQRRGWNADPVRWATERLGIQLWTSQRTIFNSVRDYRRTAVQSCHEVGKTFTAALAALWWIDTNPPGEAFVVTSAPSGPQVKAVLWREIGRAHANGRLAGRVNQTEWYLRMPAGNEELVAMGRKPDEYNPTAFQGIHARRVLVIFDEANGIRGTLHEAADSLIANDLGKALYLSNPDDPTGEFYEACKSGSGWNVVQISAFDSPNFTGEELSKAALQHLIGRTYVEEKRARWAPMWTWTEDRTRCVPPADGKLEDTHPFWQSKVLGQFPVQSAEGSLIPLTWIRAAMARDLPASGPNELGLDVGASVGGDPSCCGQRRGPVFRILWEMREPDTMKTTRRAQETLRATEAETLKVDYIGVGRGVVDRSKELNLPVVAITVGESGTIRECLRCHHEWDEAKTRTDWCPECGADLSKKVYANLLSQLWWSVREIFERGEIDLDAQDTELMEELLTIRWEPNSKGQVAVKYVGNTSPNRADALLMTFAPVPVEEYIMGCTW